MDELKLLIKQVLDWWEEHKSDVGGGGCCPKCGLFDDDEYNIYDEPPELVTTAINLKKKFNL